ncbi:MAG: glycosyltransferase family 2 protein [Anaerolineales bacterium]|nr:glycosyltransferase family 2 protein [Anaerolineales bacterium]
MSACVCAIVVTYNRKILLQECLDALLAQTHPPDRILVIDNASADGTAEALRTNGYLEKKLIEYIGLPLNIGGAGGFHEGIKRAYQQGFDWLWLMDDDSIPEVDALAQLFKAHRQFDEANRPTLLASKVVWTDGSLHPMNPPIVKVAAPESLLLAAQHATASIRCNTFVSLLLHRSLVEKYGLPVADYFIWSDDIEYTARILRYEFGVVVPTSVVWHKTAKKYTHMNDAGPRYYYHLRNNLWIITRSQAFSRKEKIKETLRIISEIPVYLVRSSLKWSSLRAVTFGLIDGIFKSPKKQ